LNLESKNSIFRASVLVILVAGAALILDLVSKNSGGHSHLGFLSLLPAFTAITLALITREVLPALLAGVIVGGIVSNRHNVVQEFLLPAIGSSQYAMILIVYLWCLGGLIGLWSKNGAALAFGSWAGSKMVRGPRTARLFAWIMGVIFHQGGTISTILAGTTVKPVTDKHRISHEELSYVVDSTASPIAGIIPFNIWPIYVSGLVAGVIPLLPDTTSAITFFYRAIPYNFYGIIAVVLTFLFSLSLLPWKGSKMKRAIHRARTTGALDEPGSKPLLAPELQNVNLQPGYVPSLFEFFIPITTLIGVALGSFLIRNEVMIAEAFVLSALTAFVISFVRGISITNLVSAFVEGCKGMTIGALILGLAVTLGFVSRDLGTAAYIIELTGGAISPIFLPVILLALCMLIAFSTGTSFGTFAVVFPIALPLAWEVSHNPDYIALCFAAVIGGSMYGDQCSPISDTTILSSVACGADLIDHVKTQLPLATLAALIAAICFLLAAWLIL
jgi:Na+/H+ antiporter NhaC